MKINFTAVRWKNLLSTGNAWTEVRLDSCPMTLIVGENGAGKSTFIEAIFFGLFGKPFRAINKPQLVNSINQKGLLVEVDFFSGQNTFTVRRGIKPSIFEIVKNGETIDQDASVKDYQDYLEKMVLGFNHRSLSQIVTLGSSSYVPFMQLQPQQRREFIEDLLDISIFSIMTKLMKERIDKNKEETKKLESTVLHLQDLIIQAMRHKEQAEKDVGEQRARIEQKILDVEATIQEKKSIHTKTWIEIKKLGEMVTDKKAVLQESEKNRSLLTHALFKLRSLKKDVDFFSKNTQCPTCHQEISEHFQKTSIDNTTTEILQYEHGKQVLHQEDDRILSRLNEIQKIEDRMASLHQDSLVAETFIKHENLRVKTLQKELESITSTGTTFAMDELNKLLKEKESAETSLLESKRRRMLLATAAATLKDDGIKSRIIKQYVPLLNSLINQYLEEMDFFVKFEINEMFEESIKSRFRDEFTYASFSEGEKLRINLAMLFSFRAIAESRNSTTTNLLIMDEILDSSLDSGGSDDFLKILKQVSKNTNAFIISHKGDQLIDKFNSVVRFVKDGDFSRREDTHE
jgi:Kyanoviridae SbcC-like subunit of palindrome specific endonuclease